MPSHFLDLSRVLLSELWDGQRVLVEEAMVHALHSYHPSTVNYGGGEGRVTQDTSSIGPGAQILVKTKCQTRHAGETCGGKGTASDKIQQCVHIQMKSVQNLDTRPHFSQQGEWRILCKVVQYYPPPPNPTR